MLIAWPYFTLVYCHGWRRDPCPLDVSTNVTVYTPYGIPRSRPIKRDIETTIFFAFDRVAQKDD